MKVSVWRITKKKHAKSAFTGEGARLYGGCWNSPGNAIIYTAQTQSLAVLEMLVHLESPKLLRKYLLFEAVIESSYIIDFDRANLPRNWKSSPDMAETQAMGDEWMARAKSAVFRVPSILVPGESNFLLNSRHPDFRKILVRKPVPFLFDHRF